MLIQDLNYLEEAANSEVTGSGGYYDKYYYDKKHDYKDYKDYDKKRDYKDYKDYKDYDKKYYDDKKYSYGYKCG